MTPERTVQKEATMRSIQTKPYMLANEESQFFEASGALVSLKASWEQTGGAFNLFEVICPPGYATPLHIHYAEDVAVYVLDGALTFFWGAEQRAAVPGSYFYQPRDIPHGFRVEGNRPARMLYLTFPAGLDRFVVGQQQSPPDTDAGAEAARYQIEVLGPLPE
jgi:quercetin dioxygenase-like cupin family protein